MRATAGVLPCITAIVTVALVLACTWSPVSGQSLAARGTRAAGSYQLNPDPPCFDNANRYVNCGNGTVADTHTGLIWLQDAGCLGSLNWADANRAAAALGNGQCGLTDGSTPGDWRLPNNAEWMAMVDAAKNHLLLQCTNPALTDDSGSVCFGDGSGSSFSNLARFYWSSTTNSQSSGLLPDATKAGVIDLSPGLVLTYSDKSCCPQQAWPVRAH
jgi:hypothetical protein